MEHDNFDKLIIFCTEQFDLDLLLNKRKPTDKKEILLLDVYHRLNDVKTVADRIKRYRIYFESFYPDSEQKITHAEALEYHLHSYLQDFYSFKEKAKKIINLLKNRLKLFDIENLEEVKVLLIHTVDQLEKSMESTTSTRRRHVHDSSVRDSEISNAKLLKTLVDIGELSDEQISKRYAELLIKAKENYIAQSIKNNENIDGIKNYVAPRIGLIVAQLYEKDYDVFNKMISK